MDIILRSTEEAVRGDYYGPVYNYQPSMKREVGNYRLGP